MLQWQHDGIELRSHLNTNPTNQFGKPKGFAWFMICKKAQTTMNVHAQYSYVYTQYMVQSPGGKPTMYLMILMFLFLIQITLDVSMDLCEQKGYTLLTFKEGYPVQQLWIG